MDFRTLIIGNDINAYYLARCYHEFTGKKADLISNIIPGMIPFAYTRYTKILNLKFIEKLWDEDVFLNAINEYYEEHKEEKILLVSSNETYGEFISKNKNKLKKKFYFNYPSIKMQNTLVNKEVFYKTYGNSIIDIPKTTYFNCKNDTDISDELLYPVILKPANVIKYKHINFKGNKKIYRLNTKEEVLSVIDLFKNAGYDDTLIIQEYIPGDDTHLFDAVIYADKNKKCKLVSFAEIGLQEHGSRMIGNATVLINGYSKFPGVTEQINKIKEFINKIGYQGFAEFDMKYDERDGKYKVMEINARQGRCSYYITPCGFNLIEVLYRDLILKEELEYNVAEKVQLETFVSKYIVKKYIKDEDYKNKVLELWKKRVNPLEYKKDNGLLRFLMLLKIRYYYYEAYKEANWDWD